MRTWAKASAFVGALAILAGECGAQSVSGGPLVIGLEDGPEDQIFSQLTDVARTPDGWILALDQWASTLRIYSPQGEHVGDVGGFGQGPGEFREPVGLAMEDGTAYVLDPGNTRIAMFDVRGSVVELAGGFRIERYSTDLCVEGGHVFTLTPRDQELITVLDEQGGSVREFGEQVEGSSRVAPEFDGEPRSELSDGTLDCSSEGGVVFASQFAGQVRRYTTDGTLLWSVDLPEFFPTAIRSVRGMCCAFSPNEVSGTHEQLFSIAIRGDVAWVNQIISKVDRQATTRHYTIVLRLADGVEVGRFPSEVGVVGFFDGREYGYTLFPFSRISVH